MYFPSHCILVWLSLSSVVSFGCLVPGSLPQLQPGVFPIGNGTVSLAPPEITPVSNLPYF